MSGGGAFFYVVRCEALPLKIAYISQPFDNPAPPDPGGSLGIWTWEVARRLALSQNVTVFAPRAAGQPEVSKWERVKFVRIPLNTDLRLLTLSQVFLKSTRSPFALSTYYCAYAVRVAVAVRRLACDVVHIHNFSQFVPIVRKLNPRTKIVLHMHCDWLVQLDHQLIDRRLKDADAILGSSEAVTEAIRKRFPQHADRCIAIFNGVDTEAFRSVETGLSASVNQRVVYVGRISPEKGLHVLLDAFERATELLPGIRLDIIGGADVAPADYIVGVCDQPMIQGLKRFYGAECYFDFIKRRLRGDLGKSVSLIGNRPHHEINQYLSGAAVLVQPSLVESFGMPVAEAMAAGLPVIASRVGGLSELVVDGETGLLVEPDCPTALANALQRVLNDPSFAQNMGSAGRLRAEELFTWDKTVNKLHDLYAALLSARSAYVTSIRTPKENSGELKTGV